MCAVTISEYSNMLMLTGGHLPIASEPSTHTQVLDVDGESRASQAFSAGTKFVRIHAYSGCALKFGQTPVATPADTRMSAHSTELFGVQPGDCVAVIAIEQGEDMDSTALLRVLADAPAAQARADMLAKAEAAAKQAVKEAKAAAAATEQAQAVLATKQQDLETRTVALETARQDLDAQASKLAADREALDGRTALAKTEDERMSEFEKRLETRQAELLKRERAAANREQQLAAREDALKVAEQSYSQRMLRLKELAS